jgi:hypothetical protein
MGSCSKCINILHYERERENEREGGEREREREGEREREREREMDRVCVRLHQSESGQKGVDKRKNSRYVFFYAKHLVNKQRK